MTKNNQVHPISLVVNPAKGKVTEGVGNVGVFRQKQVTGVYGKVHKLKHLQPKQHRYNDTEQP
jgi:hypothetical protein